MEIFGLRIRRALRLAAATAVSAFALASGGAAHATLGGFAPNYTFPDGTPGFYLVSTGAPINPGVLVSLNPQPLPPKVSSDFADLSIPGNPVIVDPDTIGPFAVEFALTGLGGGDVSLPLPPAPDPNGQTSISTVINGHNVEISMNIGPGPVDPASWVMLNPQPLPPKVAFLAFEFNGLASSSDSLARHQIEPLAGDPIMSFTVTIDDHQLRFAPGVIPEPSVWAMLLVGVGLAGAALRRRRRVESAA